MLGNYWFPEDFTLDLKFKKKIRMGKDERSQNHDEFWLLGQTR
jgi:hypothetical protein